MTLRYVNLPNSSTWLLYLKVFATNKSCNKQHKELYVLYAIGSKITIACFHKKSMAKNINEALKQTKKLQSRLVVKD